MGNQVLRSVYEGCDAVDLPRNDHDGGYLCRHVCSQPPLQDHSQRRHLSAYGSSLPTRCTAISAVLGSDGVGVVCGFDNGSLGASVWLQGQPVSMNFSYPCCEPGDGICAVSLDADCSFDDLGEHEPSSSVLLTVGTIAGVSYDLELEVDEYGSFSPSSQWFSHRPSPNEGARYSGTSAVALASNLSITGGADSSVRIWECTRSRFSDQKEAGSSARMVRIIDGAHGGAVTAVVAAAPLGQAITAGEDGSVRLWSAKTDLELEAHKRDLKGPRAAVTQLKLDIRHHRLISGSEDCFVRMWDVAVARPTRRFCHEVPVQKPKGVAADGSHPRKGVQAVAFNSAEDLTQLASAAADGSWRIWDIRQVAPAQNFPQAHQSPIVSVDFRADRLLTASLDGVVALWDTRMLQPTSLQQVHLIGLRPAKAGSELGRKGRGASLASGCCG
ncbi:unnamed protein product [Polarella glacialis]|uniref:Uncharacterized protein n=1 Tax=Polarella glacialis TaxID=89957 RepID=A0A813JAV3_POLGL|nr:unnamed protein product [Polarella glacialis]CAE8672468.1 unnamed protein product [Polarella glacialis]|mmetsp:Transcript_16380/g.29090  ORF Transcript_16380/g.29090 Transcript_16380/m.29090 type:complete len:443 (-) Transcript_16380:27-1355(-)